MSNRYILINRSPASHGLFPKMPFHRSGFDRPPLPLSIQAEVDVQATTLYLSLQRWVDNNAFPTSNELISALLSSSVLQSALDTIGPSADNLYWWVIYGHRAGLYMSSREAILSVDSPENSSQWRRAFAFDSFMEAFQACLMNDSNPTNLAYDYNPTGNPTTAAIIRQKLISTSAPALQPDAPGSNQDAGPSDVLIPLTQTHEGSNAPNVQIGSGK
ncbi:hypothetical protein EV360DRAFT_89560 [Lentinula raphanica]|nr:hypothetical protein EV360DRAFT_89560 [Lentinula raphanica]